MPQEVIEVTEREVEIIEVIERGPVGPTGPQPNINYEVVSNARTLEAADLIAADTSGGAFTLTLPANPNNGDAVDIFDFSETFDTNPLTIARNGQPIESLNEDLVANVEGAYFTLIYTGSTRGWQVLPRYGTSGGGGESALTTQGDMLYRGVGINTRLPIGSAGQILKVNSGATAPEWGAAPATGVTSVGITGSDGIEVDSGSPVTGSGSIALGVNAATLRSHINVADGANNYTHPNHSGEVTSSGDGATTIANDVVTNAKLANVATATIKGRATAGTGDPEDLTATQVRTILNVADGAEVNVQSNWTEADSGSDAFILNKPTLGGAAALNVGTTTGTVAAGDDARLSDSRTPTTHAASHAAAGSDPVFDQNLNTSDSVIFNSLQVFAAGSPTVAKQVLLADDEGTIVGITGNEADARASLGLGTAAESNSTDFAAASHTHGNLTNDGKVGSTSGLPLKTGTAGVVEAGAFGTSAGTFCEGNDARLSDSRTPVSHSASHAAAGSDPLAPSDIGAQSIFVTEDLGTITANVTLTAARAKIYTLNTTTSGLRILLPASDVLAGDIVQIRFDSSSGHSITPVRGTMTGFFTPDIGPAGGPVTFIAASASGTSWTIALVDRHVHGNIGDQGNIGTTSGLPIKTDIGGVLQAGAFGTGAGEFAEGNHTHADLHTRSHAITSTSDHTAGNHKVFYSNGSGEIVELALGNSGEVLTSNGATSAPSFAAASGGGSSIMQAIAVGFVLN